MRRLRTIVLYSIGGIVVAAGVWFAVEYVMVEMKLRTAPFQADETAPLIADLPRPLLEQLDRVRPEVLACIRDGYPTLYLLKAGGTHVQYAFGSSRGTPVARDEEYLAKYYNCAPVAHEAVARPAEVPVPPEVEQEYEELSETFADSYGASLSICQSEGKDRMWFEVGGSGGFVGVVRYLSLEGERLSHSNWSDVGDGSGLGISQTFQFKGVCDILRSSSRY